MTPTAFFVDLADPSQGHGHALFSTRIGVCAVAWQPQAVLALQLPELDGPATRERMLRELAQRMAGEDLPEQSLWVQASTAAQLPECARQAVAGVQQLMVGWRAAKAGARGEPEDKDPAHWPGADMPEVLGDLRPDDMRGATLSQQPPPDPAGRTLPQLLDVELDWRGVPEFARQVYALTRAIPPGQTRTYGDLAQDLGGLGLARAVGQALGANPFAPVVPCHRVLAAGRQPGGFSGGQGALTKLRMLELEGAAWGGTRSLFG